MLIFNFSWFAYWDPPLWFLVVATEDFDAPSPVESKSVLLETSLTKESESRLVGVWILSLNVGTFWRESLKLKPHLVRVNYELVDTIWNKKDRESNKIEGNSMQNNKNSIKMHNIVSDNISLDRPFLLMHNTHSRFNFFVFYPIQLCVYKMVTMDNLHRWLFCTLLSIVISSIGASMYCYIDKYGK